MVVVTGQLIKIYHWISPMGFSPLNLGWCANIALTASVLFFHSFIVIVQWHTFCCIQSTKTPHEGAMQWTTTMLAWFHEMTHHLIMKMLTIFGWKSDWWIQKMTGSNHTHTTTVVYGGTEVQGVNLKCKRLRMCYLLQTFWSCWNTVISMHTLLTHYLLNFIYYSIKQNTIYIH